MLGLAVFMFIGALLRSGNRAASNEEAESVGGDPRFYHSPRNGLYNVLCSDTPPDYLPIPPIY